MAAIKLTEAEQDLLDGMGPHINHVYTRGFRPRMDFRTGIVGRTVRISYRALREWTETRARPGVKYAAYTVDQLRGIVGQLLKLGLLVRMGGPRDFVFLCRHAETDQCARNKVPKGSPGPGAGLQASAGNGSRASGQTGRTPRSAIHPESGKSKPTPLNPPRRRREKQAKPIDPLTPAAREEGQDSSPPRDARTQQPSEQRHEDAGAVGGGPAALQSDVGREPDIAWQVDLAWPVGLGPTQRARVAQIMARAPAGLRQVVMDEWRGRMELGDVGDPFAMLGHYVNRSLDPGWVPYRADGVRQRREAAHAAKKHQAQQLARLQARAGPATRGPPPGWHAGLLRGKDPREASP